MTKTITEINLDTIYTNNKEINKHAETKSYYSLVLLGLLSVPLFSLLVDMLDHNLFMQCNNKWLFISSLVFFLLSLLSLVFSFIPRMANVWRMSDKNDIDQIAKKLKSDYYHYRFWGNLKKIKYEKIVDYVMDLENITGNVALLAQIINIAWIAKIKFIAIDQE
jgi:hypothetical protein